MEVEKKGESSQIILSFRLRHVELCLILVVTQYVGRGLALLGGRASGWSRTPQHKAKCQQDYVIFPLAVGSVVLIQNFPYCHSQPFIAAVCYITPYLSQFICYLCNNWNV